MPLSKGNDLSCNGTADSLRAARIRFHTQGIDRFSHKFGQHSDVPKSTVYLKSFQRSYKANFQKVDAESASFGFHYSSQG